MADVNLTGLGVALVTPFKKDLSIDYVALERLLDKVSLGECDYIVVLGTTAETPTLSLDEKFILTKFIKEKINGNLPLVLGIGGNCTEAVVNDILRSDLDGYCAILSVTPFYNKPSQEGLFMHFKTICDVSPLPILLYNVPSRTGVNLSAKTTIKLANYSEKICGIKEASGNLQQAAEIVNNTPSGFAVISGNDGDIFPMMRIGAAGVISVLANAFPNEVKKLVSLCTNHNFDIAETYQQKLSGIIGPLFEEGNPSGIKDVLTQMGIIENVLRLPLVPVSGHVEEKLKHEIFLLNGTRI